MKKKILLIPLAVLLLSAMAAPALAQYTWDVGIEVGDWFEYEGTLVWWDADEGVAFPPMFLNNLKTWNESDRIRYTVTDITPGTGANITFSVVTYWTNGSDTTSTLVDNMTSSFSLMVIGANLGEGDEIRPENPTYSWPVRTLNASIMLDTPNNGTREMNVLNWTHPSGTVFPVFYWDKELGIQVFYQISGSGTDFSSGGSYNYIGKVELVDSSMLLAVPDLTPLILLLTSMSITIPIALLHRRRKAIHLK